MIAKLRVAFDQHVSDHYIEMTETETEVRIRLDSRVFFRRGSAELHPAAYAILADVGRILATERVDIRVEGFADGVGTEQANWELSTDRSVAVVLALREKGPIPGDRLEAVGFGSFHPGVGVGLDADWDRRVEIVLNSNEVAGAAAASRFSDRGSE
jgi:chemotaxis protein MotB